MSSSKDYFLFHIRHGPLDIQGGGGGGGAWVFGPGQDIFFRQNRSKIIFYAGVTTNNDTHRKSTPGHFST